MNSGAPNSGGRNSGGTNSGGRNSGGTRRGGIFGGVAVGCVVAGLLLGAPVVYGQQSAYERVQQLERRAVQAAEEYELTLAIQYLNQLLALDPNSFFAHSALARHYFAIRDIELARVHTMRARRLNQQDLEIQILLARIYIAESDFARAAQLLQTLMRAEPRNVRLQLAQAELAVAQYNYAEAIRLYQSVLGRDRDNIVALLGLALLRQQQGERAAAEELIARARIQAPQRLAAYFLSAQHYLLGDQYEVAQRHIAVALEIAPTDPPTRVLASEIARARGALSEAQIIIEGLLESDSRRPLYWYMHGAILAEQAQYEPAIESLRRALLLRRDYEVARFAAEALARQYLSENDARRPALAAYRFERARALRDRNLLDQAGIQVRRGLQVHPFSEEGRLLRAEIERANDFDAKYRRELELAQEFGADTQFVSDRIETIAELLSSRPAAEWEVDQFTLDRDALSIGVVMNRTLSRVTVDATLQHVGAYLADILRFSERLTVADLPLVVNAQTPFQIGEPIRDYDYILHCYLLEGEHGIQLIGELISPLSRAALANRRASFIGAERYGRAARAIADWAQAALPLRGQIIARRQERALINMGRAQGIAPAQELVVVQADALAASDAALGFRYPDSSEIGRITITEVDDLVAEGTIARQGLFDNVTIGDEVFLPSRALPQRAALNTPSPLYDYILQLR